MSDTPESESKFDWSAAGALMDEEIHAAAKADPEARPTQTLGQLAGLNRVDFVPQRAARDLQIVARLYAKPELG